MNARTLALIGTAAGFLAVAACEQSSSPDRVSAPTGGPQSDSEQAPAEAPTVGDTSEAAESASAQAGDMWSGERVYAGNVSFGVPEGWVVRPPSNQMRAAEVAAPGDGGGTGPVAAFSLAGGGAEANIQRWIGQFTEPDALRSRETRDLAGRTVHIVEMAGSYRGMGGTAEPGTAMLAAIVEQPGQPSVFVKMTGPEAEVAAARDGWIAMIESLSSP